MSDGVRARRSLNAGLAIAVALSFLVHVGPSAHAQSCPPDLFNSGIAWTGKSVVLVASDNPANQGGNLYYFWQKTGTSTWHRELVAAAGCAGSGWQPVMTLGYESNAIAWTGDSVIIAAVDIRNGGLYDWWQANGGTTWHQQTVAAGPPGCCSFSSWVNGKGTPMVMGYSQPSIAWTGKSVVLAATDPRGLHYWFQEKGKTTWHHQLVYAYVGSPGDARPQPAIAWTGASVVIADQCQGNGYGLCYYWQAAGSNVWHRQIVDFGSSANPSIAWTGSAVIIAADRYDPNTKQVGVAYWWQAAGTTTWHMQQVSTPRVTPYNDRDFSTPSIAAAGGSIVIAAVDESTQAQQLDYWWEPATSNGGWTQQTPSGTDQYSGFTRPRSIAWTGVSVIITSTDACGDLDYWWQKVGTATWNKQRVSTNPGWPPGTC